MKYEEFKAKVLAGLRELYGESADIRVDKVLKNNGRHYDGVQIRRQGSICPTIPLEMLYEIYCDGDMDIRECVRAVSEISEKKGNRKGLPGLADNVMDWEQIRGSIYPIILSTEMNRELAETVVSTTMMDLTVMYIVRAVLETQCVSIKVSHAMLKAYNVSAEELHRQALKNLEGDGYQFRDIHQVVNSYEFEKADDMDLEDMKQPVKMYILTNAVKFYGAAGILDRKLIREFAGGRNFFILPSSIHETIFVPDDGTEDGKSYSRIVKMVNEHDVDIEERLSDHAYFYDGAADEIRICA